jgi:hypothetical protein
MIARTVLICAAAGLAAACTASEASAGEIGANSRETVVISLSVAPRIEVQGIADLESGGRPPDSTGQGSGICVSANTATRGYGISLIVPAGAIDPAPGAGRVAILWSGQPAGSGAAQIPAGGTVMGFVASASPCTARSDPNARLIIHSLAGAPRGEAGSAAATLLIVPE